MLSDPSATDLHPAGDLASLIRPDSAERLVLLATVIDELDYGLLVVRHDGRLVHANHAGRQHCADPNGALALQPPQRVQARRPDDQPELARALDQAARLRLRCMLRLGGKTGPETIAIVPLSGQDDAVLVVFGRRQVCEMLSIEHFSHAHGLTHAESMVLAALCDGDDPADVARRYGVALSTVRTQIASIRQKTGATSLRALVHQVALLPPIVSALSHVCPH